MSNKKYLIIFIYLSVAIFLTLIILILLKVLKTESKNGSNIITPDPLPTQGFFKKPTLTPFIRSTIEPIKEKLKIIKVLPEENLSEKHLPILPVRFVFSSPVDLKNVFFEVSPKVETRTRQDSPNVVIIQPKVVWQKGTTIITILDKTFSNDGSFLEKTFIYEFNSDLPEERPG